MEKYRKICFIGAGNMAEAMIGALLQSGLRRPKDIVISDVSTARAKAITRTYNVASALSNPEAVTSCNIVILAVKPQVMDSVLTDLLDAGCFESVSSKRLFISIAAGIPLKRLEGFIYKGRSGQEKSRMPVIRVMPNTPALVGAGMSGMCANAWAGNEDIEEAKTLLSAMGEVLVFDEEKMDAVTAVSGSGPAYGFYLLEAMTEAGRKLGLEHSDALKLSLSAVSGAVRLVQDRKEDPENLRSKVTSPGGTTEAALSLLDTHQVKDRLVDAVLAAARRSRDLRSSQDA